MYAAAWNGHVLVIETLVRLGSKAIDTPTINGWTPVYCAAHGDHMDCLRTLISLGADCSNTLTFRLSDAMVEQLKARVEDESGEVRYRVYFTESLVSRLLFEVDVQLRRVCRRVH